MRYKGILFLCDGMGDRPIDAFGGQTVLEYASLSNMDRIARLGICGLMSPLSPGVRPGSDTAHLSLLGFDPYKYYTARGPLEAKGVGLEVQEGDLGFRTNFVFVEEATVKKGLLKGIVKDRRAGRISEGTDELAEALNQVGEVAGVRFFFKESVQHRGALVLRGENLSDKITDSVDPGDSGLPVGVCEPLEANDEASRLSARAVNEFVVLSYEILKEHPVNKKRREKCLPPANAILPRGGGRPPRLEPFSKRHEIKGACVVEVALLKGIARYLEIDIFEPEGSTGGLDTDLDGIGKAVLEALEENDFVLCNVKGPDVAGHDGKPEAKKTMLERIDTMLGTLFPPLIEDIIFALASDHVTPVTAKAHCGEPVPLAICGPGVLSDDVVAFNERALAKGGLGHILGADLMPILTNLMNVQKKFGA